MQFERVEHFNFEAVRDRYYWHVVQLALFAALTFVFSVTELKFEMPLAREQAPRKVQTEYRPIVLGELVQELQAYEPGRLVQGYKLIDGGDHVSVHFGTSKIFNPGHARFVPGAREEMYLLGQILKKFDGRVLVRIEGHTDDVPIVVNAWQYPTNWELSSARAARIGVAFNQMGLNRRYMEIVGRGEGQPLLPNRTPAGAPIRENQLANRRVVIRFQELPQQ